MSTVLTAKVEDLVNSGVMEAAADGDIEYSDASKLARAPLVSVDMITYQHAPFIRAALDSVLAQKVQFPYEICIGEDGSTDGTREICLEYAKAHPDKIRVFLRNRSNPARKVFKAPYMHNAARTFDACRGKYIALLEGDDYWLHPHKLQWQVDQMESDANVAASCHYALAVRDEQPWGGTIIPDYPIECFTVEDLLKRDVGSVHTSTWLLRRGKPMNWDSFHTSSFGDYPLFVWTLLQGRAVVSQRVLSVYRIHEQGVFSPLSHEHRLQENVELWKRLGAILPLHLHLAMGIGLLRTLTMYTRALIKAGKFRSAWAGFKRTLSEIEQLQLTSTERKGLRLLAVQTLLFPRLGGPRKK